MKTFPGAPRTAEPNENSGTREKKENRTHEWRMRPRENPKCGGARLRRMPRRLLRPKPTGGWVGPLQHRVWESPDAGVASHGDEDVQGVKRGTPRTTV